MQWSEQDNRRSISEKNNQEVTYRDWLICIPLGSMKTTQNICTRARTTEREEIGQNIPQNGSQQVGNKMQGGRGMLSSWPKPT